jgi:predicted kinase
MMEINMPNFYMLIGVPASGKSTWREQHAGDALVISSDDLIEQYAASQGKTYNEVFKEQIKIATQIVNDHAKAAFAAEQDVIWDQTNITKKSRKSKLALVPPHYRKTAVFFATPLEEEWQRRLNSRQGKSVPAYILDSMVEMLEMPDLDEGWDAIDYHLNAE